VLEGYLFQVAGPCDGDGAAGLEIPPIPGLVVPDGEVRLEARVVSGHDRAQIELLTRRQHDPGRRHNFVVSVHHGLVMRFSLHAGESPVLGLGAGVVQRNKLEPDGLNSLAVGQKRLDV
jgi:hypothetical protein